MQLHAPRAISRKARPCAVVSRNRSFDGAKAAANFSRHLGVYAFRPRALERCCELPLGALERIENLEQLRWLEAGEKIRVLDAAQRVLGIDTRLEYDAFVARCKARA